MKSSKLKIIAATLTIQMLLIASVSMVKSTPKYSIDEDMPTEVVTKRSFPIEIRTIGELEAARSTSISSSLRGDQAKIIQLIADGANVQAGDLLVKIDSTPYEKTVDELVGRIKEYESHIEALKNALDWEVVQADHETKTAAYEMETAELELNKTIQGDGPLEAARLQSIMQKTKIKFEELNAYSQDLLDLETQGFLNPIEVRQAQKKLQEEREAYESAKMQHDSYINHVYPMLIKKAETNIKRLINKQEESARAGGFKIAKADALLNQAEQELLDVRRQLQNARQELALTEITAPSPGMVVQREEYRSSQRRKPRVGDLLVKNQPILDLPDLNSMIVKTKVREIDLFKIDNGKEATIEVDAYPNLQLKGKVIFIGILALSEGIRAGDEKYFEVKVSIDETDPRLRPGMTSRVVIHADKVTNALTVPIHAIFEFNKKHYCYVTQKKGYLLQPVSIGMNNEHWVAVNEGLNEHDQICLTKPLEQDVIHIPENSEDTKHASRF
ncbi:MAG: efflux RND transporter periplasmic adaptor subunit [Parachlamydiaceae bacterium]|nr:efflux RND transporter periplasmic adaptor subunit [Parachlamydiaceae bacterium]